MLSKKISILFICLSLTYTSCTIAGTYYIRNLSNESTQVTMYLKENARLLDTDLGLPFKSEIQKVKKNSYKKLKETLSFEKISPQHIQFDLPAQSMVLIGGGMNAKIFDVIAVEVNSPIQKDTFDFTYGVNEHTYWVGRLGGGYAAHYDIGK